MPLIGWLAGTTIVHYIADYDHWVAFGLLAFVGLRMIHSGLRADAEELKADPSRGWTLVMLSIAVSIDALAIGLSLGLIGVTIWYPAVVIGVVTGLVSLFGLRYESVTAPHNILNSDNVQLENQPSSGLLMARPPCFKTWRAKNVRML